jgi:2-iminobutanoate/2-iminopropanoate deaminase
MVKKCVVTEAAPQAIGPYSQATVQVSGSLVFCSGQIPVDPATGEVVGGGIREQTERVLRNLEAVLAAAGSSNESVLKTTVYLSNMDDFKEMNAVYESHFATAPPARAAVEVARLPLDVSVEIEAIALVK